MKTRASLFAGDVAEARCVEVTWSTDRVLLAADGEGAAEIWRYAALVVVDGAKKGDLRLRHGQALLVVRGDDAVTARTAVSRAGLSKRAGKALAKEAGLMTVISVVAVALIVAALDPVSDVAARAAPTALADHLGDVAWRRGPGFANMECRGPNAAEARDQARAVLTRLVGTAEAKSYDIRFIRNESPNAFALPDGKIVFTSGFFSVADGGDAFAGVMAHEIGHVRLRHSLRRIIATLSARSLAMMIAGMESGAVLSAIYSASYSRGAEAAADAEAAAILSAANVDPGGMARFFEDIRSWEETRNGHMRTRVASMMSSHPESEDRAARLRKAALQGGPFEAVLDGEAWAALQNACRGARHRGRPTKKKAGGDSR